MSILNQLDNLKDELNLIESKYRILWDHLLDDDNGISYSAYNALIELGDNICPSYVDLAKNFIKSENGRFYMPRNEETI